MIVVAGGLVVVLASVEAIEVEGMEAPVLDAWAGMLDPVEEVS